MSSPARHRPGSTPRLPALPAPAISRRLLQQLKDYPAACVFLVATILFAGFCLIGQARYLAIVIDSVFLQGLSLEEILPPLSMFLVLSLLRALLTWSGDLLAQRVSGNVKQQLRHDLLSRALQVGAVKQQDDRSGEWVSVIGEGVEKLDGYYRLYLPQVIQAALLPVSILFITFPYDRITGWILLGVAPLIPLFMVLIGSSARKATEQQWNKLQSLSAEFVDILSGITTLKIFGRAGDKARRMRTLNETFRDLTMKVLRLTFLSALVMELISTLSTAVLAVQIGLRLLYANIAFLDALFILILAPDFFLPLRMLGLRFHAGMEATAAAVDIFHLLDREPPSRRGSRKADGVKGQAIRFEQVSYTYPQREEPAVESLSFTLPAGETTVLAGPSGAGKSTIARLLLGFLEPDAGTIFIGENDLANLDHESWRDHVAWVPQRPLLLHATVLENIRFAAPEASMAAVQQAARHAHADSFIEKLPAGYATPIGEHGMRLSGGQAQRLALARAFLKDAPILILDEPAAQLDLESEALLLDSLERLTEGRTVLLIAHRQQTIQHARHRIILRDGKLVHDDGLATNQRGRDQEESR